MMEGTANTDRIIRQATRIIIRLLLYILLKNMKYIVKGC